SVHAVFRHNVGVPHGRCAAPLRRSRSANRTAGVRRCLKPYHYRRTETCHSEGAMTLIRSCGIVAALVLCLSVRPSAAQEGRSADLVTRSRMQLYHGGAEMIIAEARQKAAEMNLKVNIAVVDDGG